MESQRINIALSGNPNCGKSTIFNNLTGSRQHVGNYPGVTVEKKEGQVNFKGFEINVVDLPGTYSLSAYSEDEMVARDFLIKEKIDVIIHVVDSSNLERNLYLGTQLMELNVPLVFAMNMSDIAQNAGYNFDYQQLSQLLGAAIVKTVGNKNIGTEELLETIINIYEKKINLRTVHIEYGPEIRDEIIKLEKIINKEPSLTKEYPWSWFSLKMLENDPEVIKIITNYSIADELKNQIKKSRHHIHLHFGDYPETIIADRRYGFISGACMESLKPSVAQRHDISDKIDELILNKALGIPIFALVMFVIFKFTFTFSKPLIGLFEQFFEKLADILTAVLPQGLFQSLVVDGVIGGVGGVLSFFPLVLFMFFAIAFFEDSGYMARAAFVMDKIMSKFGLHGKSFLPLMISTNGCAVPGIMATRTLESKKDRLITMMVTPFMICGAKLPILSLFIAAFFPIEYGANIMFLMYFISVAIAFSSAWILKRFVFKGETAHFVMELPPYRMPTLKGMLLKMWERGWLYLQKAGTVIVLFSIVIWACFTFPQVDKNKTVEKNLPRLQIEQSFAGRAGKFIEPVVKPIGMDWRGAVALISGVAAKEIVVSTFGTIYSLGDADSDNTDSLKAALQKDKFWNPLKAFSFLIFCLIYFPCFVTMAVFYRESGSSLKWTLFLVFWTTVMAWMAAFIVYQGGMLLGFGV